MSFQDFGRRYKANSARDVVGFHGSCKDNYILDSHLLDLLIEIKETATRLLFYFARLQ